MLLQITLLGKAEVQSNIAPIAPFRGKSTLYLFAALVLHANRPVERKWLAETLWPESDPTRGLYNLRRALHDLRQALGRAAERVTAPRPSQLQLMLQPEEADVLRFLQAIEDSDSATALAHYGGPLLPSCSLLWFEEKRVALARDAAQALESLAVQSPPHEAILLWQKRLQDDPFHEAALRGLMQALAETHQLLEARRMYRQFRLRLHEARLGEPSLETQALLESLQASPPPRSLPTLPLPEAPRPLTAFFGRESELEQLGQLLQSPQTRLVTILGLGGVGKTRLALELAAQLSTPAAFLPLVELTDSRQLAHFLWGRLFPDARATEPERELIERIRALGPTLLILDNLEQLVGPESQALLERLLQQAPQCQILVTSRQPLRIPGEQLLALEPLAVPAHPPQNRQLLREFPCVQLLESRARAFRPDFEILQQSPTVILALCHHSEGIPLAVELIASHLRLLTPELLVKHLTQLSGPRERLEAIFKSTLALLPTAQQSAFRRLHLFRGGFTLEAAQAVLGDQALSKTLTTLETLHDLSFLTVRGSQFFLPEPLREFAQKSCIPEESNQTQERYREYFRAFCKAQEPLFLSQRAQAHAVFDEEQENICLAFTLSPDTEKIELTISFCLHAFARPALAEFLEQALTLTAETSLQRARLCDRFGALYGNLGHWERAEPLLKEALSLYSPTEHRRATAHIQGNLGAFFADAQRWDEAEAILIQASEQYKALELPYHQAIALTNRGVVALRTGNYVTGERFFSESLGLRIALGDTRGIAITKGNLGMVALHQGELGKAERLYEEALETLRPLKDPMILSSALDGLAATKAAQGAFPDAARLFGEAAGWRVQANRTEPPTWWDTVSSYQECVLAALGSASWEYFFSEGQQDSNLERSKALAYDRILPNLSTRSKIS